MPEFDRLVDRGDVDGLLRAVDDACHHHRWSPLVSLRQRCIAVSERGHQLWPVAAHIAYRLALEAPATVAVSVLDADGRFLPGPLTEVMASRHTWAELDPALVVEPLRTIVAHERIAWGEDLTDAAGLDPNVLDLPLRLQPWEPTPTPPDYQPHGVTVTEPEPARDRPVELGAMGVATEDPMALDALTGLVRPWIEQSNGRAVAVAVHGDGKAAVAALGPRRVSWEQLNFAEATLLLTMTAASGGAHGRRRGLARGRFEAWWTTAALGGALDDWPLAPGEIAEIGEAMRWANWDPGDPPGGWRCHLAVEDPIDGLGWALSATDAR